jgi:GAF domain-containing protein
MPRNAGLKGEGSRRTSSDGASVPDLQGFVASACERIETVDWATLTFAAPNELDGVEADPRIREIEALQSADNDGPAFEALRTRRICRIASTATSPGWPALRQLCRRHGVMSMACVPVIVDGVVVATMNLYSRDYHAFGPAETRAALGLAGEAGELIAGSISSTTNLDRESDVQHR